MVRSLDSGPRPGLYPLEVTVLPSLRSDDLPPGPHEARLSELALTVLVGVTGVGKSTALNALHSAFLQRAFPEESLRVLPDRREVTDAVMILPLAGGPVRDRQERFRLTALYRETHPGGMAQALGSLIADTAHWGSRPVFDGLRGLDEVEYAAANFSQWRFVALGAPDVVRVRRLLGRADSFDQVQAADTSDLRVSLADIPGVEGVFMASELDALSHLTARGFAPADILAKVRIVVSERQHYDPAAAEAFLSTLPPERALILNTVILSPEQVAQRIGAWA